MPQKRRAASLQDPDSDSDSGTDVSAINVDFDFVAPQPVDYHAVKRLFVQLFYTHAPSLDLAPVTDYILKRGADESIGTVIKVDGDEDADPFAFVSAIDLSLAETDTAARSLTNYFLARLSSEKSFHSLLSAAAERKGSTPPITLVAHERMINMPAQVAPPLFRILGEELERRRTEITPTPPAPSHLLFFSRVFSADALSEDEDMSDDDQDAPTGLRGAKRRKTAKRQAVKKEGVKSKNAAANLSAGAAGEQEEMGLFHPEDGVIARFATHKHTFRFPPPKDAAESFEAPIFGRLVAVPYTKLAEIITAIENELGPVGA